jgi:flotillin
MKRLLLIVLCLLTCTAFDTPEQTATQRFSKKKKTKTPPDSVVAVPLPPIITDTAVTIIDAPTPIAAPADWNSDAAPATVAKESTITHEPSRNEPKPAEAASESPPASQESSSEKNSQSSKLQQRSSTFSKTMETLFTILSSGAGIIAVLLIVFVFLAIKQYKRCPSNRILVIYGKVGSGRSAKCIHGGGAFIIPLIQDSQYMTLQPIPIEINLTGALSKQNIRVNVPSTFTVAISTDATIMLNAAERLLGLNEPQIKEQAQDIILGQLRLVIATLTIEEINKDRELFLRQINENVATELYKIGLQLINVNIKDITDESGYIEAIGRNSAAEAVNRAKVAVAEQERFGAIGQAKANRERTVQVSLETTETEKGQKEAEKNKRMALAQLETDSAISESKSAREKDIELARQKAETDVGLKQAEAQRRISVAELEAQTASKENLAKALAAESNAMLAEKNAQANQRAEVAKANAQREILKAQKDQETARLEKDELVQQEVNKLKIQVDSDAEAERIRRVAQGEADAILLKYKADAEGLKKLLQAKAEGYQDIIRACGNDPNMASTLLLLEKLEGIVGKQVDAISNLKIDKITVWDSGNTNGDGGSSTSNFLRSMVGALPPLQEIARQAGIELPSYLGTIKDTVEKPTAAKVSESKQLAEKSGGEKSGSGAKPTGESKP